MQSLYGIINTNYARKLRERIKNMLKLPTIFVFEFQISYCQNWEGNRAADKFAQMGHQLVEPRIWRGVPPDEVLAIVLEDAQGKIVLRRKG
ncbi:hypothetical protein P8452_15431 [Trifolium repens]|nr:hypothetical protein P8452_15431 [Trifolium repens]